MSKFGDICTLLAKSGTYTHWSLAKIGEAIGYPLSLDQCFVYYREEEPVGVITYAYVSEEALTALMAGQRIIRREDWQSGEHLFVPDLIAPFGDVRRMAKHFHKFVKDTHGDGFRCNWYRPALKRTGYAKTR